MTIPMTILVIFTFLFLTFYFFWRARQVSKSFAHHVRMTVGYLFQELPGQYSSDRRLRNGVLIFMTKSCDEQVKNIVIKKVRPHNTALRVNLDQILVILFDREDTNKAEVSVRFKVVKRDADISELKGELVSISGVLNFEYRKAEAFRVVLPIGDVYQEIEAP